jgi:uncharacterized protein YjiS (DUF1127 family)
MIALSPGNRGSLLKILAKWWLSWTERRAAISELRCYAEEEVERTAKDLGVSPAEIHKLVRRGPEGANLLLRRMAALGLDRTEVARTEPDVFHDLQRVCTLCDHRRRCVRDLGRDASDASWQDYCPNAGTLMALNALPWITQRHQ